MPVVLIVGDHVERPWVIALAITPYVQPIVVRSGLLAIQHVTSHAVDLIIIDDRLTGMTGVDLLHTLQKPHDAPPPPIVMICAVDRNCDDALFLGAAAVFEDDQLGELVEWVKRFATTPQHRLTRWVLEP